MKHDLFRHIEIEIFVPRSRLEEALGFVRSMLEHFSGDRAAIDAPTRQRLAAAAVFDDLEPCRGTYTHHYPICVRRVLPDDTLVSMASMGRLLLEKGRLPEARSALGRAAWRP